MFQVSEHAIDIIKELEAAGHEAYIVGGCVRDMLIGREPGDWDITTSASPEQVKAVFRRTIDTGIQHGTVTVMMDKEGYEVTTYRIDGNYVDGRHPTSVEFVSDLREDLRRRDFTINAMAYNPRTGVVDLFEGQEDLERKIIRCVGVAEERFTEDALRMMRALRFAAQLDFSVEEKTWQAICDLSPNLVKVSKERIHTELVKLLVSGHPEYVRKMYQTGIYRVFYPEYEKFADTQKEAKMLHILQNIPAEKGLRLGVMLRDSAGPRKVLKDLKLDNDTILRASKLAENQKITILPEKVEIRRKVYELGEEFFLDWLLYKEAELCLYEGAEREEKQDHLAKIRKIYQEIKERGDCLSLSELAVTGKDLLTAGVTPGPSIGKVLQELLMMVLEDPAQNQKEILLEKVQESL